MTYEIGIFICLPMISPFSFVSTSAFDLSSASAISSFEIPSDATPTLLLEEDEEEESLEAMWIP